MTIAPSDFAILQREDLLASYQGLKAVVLKNNEFCMGYSKRKQAELNKFFMANPRVRKVYDAEFKNSISPISLGVRNLHGSAKTSKMDDPVKVRLIRARVILKLANKKFPLRQDVIWHKESREYSDAEFQQGRLGLSAEHYAYLSKVIQEINFFNSMFTTHYEHLHRIKTLLEDNVDLLEGRYD
ncbi:hypothetical protein VIBNIFTn2_120003 [Vibrio nigripulchritudo FTn2]|uniref:hypothetical protein n=1 Tax=Vibrio nigripulchritudo TaxID=28173 RepID=UPI0003B187D3|nr:hypothetical protein [Vibrio nigripulchritudo]CCN40021.1 hypothetical protein VIBNIFTn2_120003 [Vibrio nigripulchritudo FTn2]